MYELDENEAGEFLAYICDDWYIYMHMAMYIYMYIHINTWTWKKFIRQITFLHKAQYQSTKITKSSEDPY